MDIRFFSNPYARGERAHALATELSVAAAAADNPREARFLRAEARRLFRRAAYHAAKESGMDAAAASKATRHL